MATHIAWLRGINVGAAGRGRKSVPMKELRALAEELGWSAPRTHVQSGNLVFEASGRGRTLEEALEAGITERFGFEVPVVVTGANALTKLLAACPFPGAAEERPNHVHAGFTKGRFAKSMLTTLAAYCKADERVELAGSCLWADYASGVARSKLTPAVLDRAAGGSVTMRNVRTLRAVVELANG